MVKKMFVLFGAVAALTAALISGCGSSSTAATGCDANLPCTVSTNIN